VVRTSAEWKENMLACCPDTRYPYVEFMLHLRRRQAFYVMNVIVPCSLLSVLVLIVFCLPPDAGEKISLGISVVLAIIVFLMTVAETIPRTSLHVPVMGSYVRRVTFVLNQRCITYQTGPCHIYRNNMGFPLPYVTSVLKAIVVLRWQ
jgi:Neurotransmitter-gated ion-channel transmembrane region